MSQKILHHIIISQAIDHNEDGEQSSVVLGVSDEFSDDLIDKITNTVTISPLAHDGTTQPTYTLVMLDSTYTIGDTEQQFVFARSVRHEDNPTHQLNQYVLISGEILLNLSGRLNPLMRLFAHPIPTPTDGKIEPLTFEDIDAKTLTSDVGLVNLALSELTNGDGRERLLAILGSAINGGVIICGFPKDTQKRLNLIQGLIMLLPKIARPTLTFSTHDDDLSGRLARVIFSDEDGASSVERFNWNSPDIDQKLLKLPYIAHLLTHWHDDVLSQAGTHLSLNSLAKDIMPKYSLLDGLNAVAERHQHDIAVIQGDNINVESMVAILNGDIPIAPDIRLLYLEKLLFEALHERNTLATEIVAHAMDTDKNIDATLQVVFDDVLEKQPDAVYVFIRTRLKEGIDERWLTRMHIAAEKSLNVAMESGDADTLASWLTLISREPLAYELSDVLRTGLLAARTRAASSANLSQSLLVIAVKRQPDVLSTFLHDPKLIDALPDEVIDAIERFDSTAIEQVVTTSRELFLLAVKQAVDVQEANITTGIIRKLWDMVVTQQMNVVSPDFRPITLIRRIVSNRDVMTNGALDTLLIEILKSENDTLFLELAVPLAENGELIGSLANALNQSERQQPAIIDIIKKLSSEELIDAQDSITVYSALIGRFDTQNKSANELLDSLARLLVQHPETTASTSIMWKIAEYTGETKSEAMLRISANRLMNDIEKIRDEVEIVHSLQRLRKASSWSSSARPTLIQWWRKFTRKLGLVQLQNIEQELEGNRQLEDYRTITQTGIALKRILGQRTLEQFAAEIHTAYNILQALSESFDPDSKNSVQLDSTTIRHELAARESELPAEQKQILSTDLKGLAQLITTVSENRSKPAILRSDESIERQLTTGEAQPQSAIDVMRWLSGYLVGMQKKDDSE